MGLSQYNMLKDTRSAIVRASVGDSLKLWLDASDTSSTNIVESGGAASQWSDKSGNANHATQSTGLDKPTTNARTINGRNALDFDGSGDNMLVPSFGSFMSGSDKVCTVFSVFQHDTTSLDYVWSFGRSSADNPVYGGRVSATDIYEAVKRDDVAAVKTPPGADTISTGTPYIAAQVLDLGGLTVDTFINGAADLVNGDIDVGTTTIDEFMIGGLPLATPSLFWDGLIGGIIVYDRRLSGVEILEVNNELSNNWRIIS